LLRRPELTLVFIGGSLFTFGLTEVYFEKPDMTILLAAYIPILLRFVEDVALKKMIASTGQLFIHAYNDGSMWWIKAC
jgi:hypothetical protein